MSIRLLPFAVIALALGMTAAALWQISESPGVVQDDRAGPSPSVPAGEPVEITVEPGQGPQKIGEKLEAAKVIDSAVQFQVLSALLGYDSLLQPGLYEFDPGTPALQAVYRMRLGITSPRTFTVIEGWRREQIADLLAENGIDRDDFLAAAHVEGHDFDFLATLAPEDTLEGYLFPATYPLFHRDTAADIVNRLLQGFDNNFPPELRQEANDAGLTVYEVLTIASIVEREAVVPEERPIIAQVFRERLREGIPLEADPTVQYALAADPLSMEEFGYWKQGLTLFDLQVDSFYNTYIYAGLPPGPIANPGLSSITAVIRPADTAYLYFVAKPDGSHAFAETFEEHLANVELYASETDEAP